VGSFQVAAAAAEQAHPTQRGNAGFGGFEQSKALLIRKLAKQSDQIGFLA